MSPSPSAEVVPASDEFTAAMLGRLEAVLRYARALTRDTSDADDLVQETFLRAFRAWTTFDMDSDPQRWLFAICRHAFFRTQQRAMRTVSVDEELELDALASVALHNSVRSEGLDRLFDRVDLRPAVTQALAALSEAHRVIVVLVDIEGLGYAEAAAELQLPIGTVRSRLFRARRLMQTALIEFARDAGYRNAELLPVEPCAGDTMRSEQAPTGLPVSNQSRDATLRTNSTSDGTALLPAHAQIRFTPSQGSQST